MKKIKKLFVNIIIIVSFIFSLPIFAQLYPNYSTPIYPYTNNDSQMSRFFENMNNIKRNLDSFNYQNNGYNNYNDGYGGYNGYNNYPYINVYTPNTPRKMCNWVGVTQGSYQLACPSGYVAGIGYEGAEWSDNNDNHNHPEVDKVLCCMYY